YTGTERGRIYRIVPDDVSAPVGTGAPHLSGESAAELVAALEHPNTWWRRNAQRLLVDRRPTEAVAPLKRLATEGGSPLGRLHAFWALDGMGLLGSELIERALADVSAGVREYAIRLAELHLEEAPALGERLPELA